MLRPVRFAQLPGWADDDHGAALAAFRLSAQEILSQGAGFSRAVAHGGRREHWLEICRAAWAPQPARRFFESQFQPVRVEDDERPAGLFTGYYEPEALGSDERSAAFSVPLYARPSDLVSFTQEERAATALSFGRRIGGKPVSYLTRREIEEGALAGQGLELVWLKDWADAFFMQIQGSGRVRLPGGRAIRLGYAAKSGLPYTGIGTILAERGDIARDQLSMQSIRRWMAEHPREARSLMWENQSFVFFRELVLDDPELGALGAQHVQLTPQRSLAVDRDVWMFGTPIWLDTSVPAGEEGLMTRFRQLLVAQDTGSAIKGLARGDLYWGFGDEAARHAGPMKSPGTMTALLPRGLARELVLGT